MIDKIDLMIKTTFIYSHADNKYDVWTPDNNGFITYTDYRGTDDQKTNAFSVYIKKSIKDFDIISISSYSHNNIIYSYDSDWGNNEYWSSEPFNFNNYYYGYYSPYNYTDYTDREKINKSSQLSNTLVQDGTEYVIRQFDNNNQTREDITLWSEDFEGDISSWGYTNLNSVKRVIEITDFYVTHKIVTDEFLISLTGWVDKEFQTGDFWGIEWDGRG